MDTVVDWRAACSFVGSVCRFLAVPLTFPLLIAVIYGESLVPFLVTVAVVLAVGTLLQAVDPDPELGHREGFLMVALTWLVVPILGSIPYLVASNGIPFVFDPTTPESVLANPANALFESMSGFTTTGSTVLEEISVDRHGHAILMWRQLTQWLGGMGIIVLMIAILPEIAVNGAELMQSEAPGPELQKLTPKIAETARALWLIYFAFTVFYVALLYALSVVPVPGYGILDAQFVLLFAMFIGGSAGSTGGGVKVVRWLVVVKSIRREMYQAAHPETVQPVRLGGHIIDEQAVREITAFTLLYILLFGFAALFIVLDPYHAIPEELTILEGISASLATLGNIGPGFGRLGPFGNYEFFSVPSKFLMIVLMWVGRLEIVPVLALFVSGLRQSG